MTKIDKESVIGITALLVHAANIDEIYSDPVSYTHLTLPTT